MQRRIPNIIDGEECWHCPTCALWLPRQEYYISLRSWNGIGAQCKKCHTATSIRTRNKDTVRKSNAEYMRRARIKYPEKFKERDRIASSIRRKNDPIKVSARAELKKAVKRGDIVKPNVCERCGVENILTGHHDNYNNPLEVLWLCYSCHGKEHRV